MGLLNGRKLMYVVVSLILIHKCRCDMYAEKKVYADPDAELETHRDDEEAKKIKEKNSFTFKCYECEDCTDTDSVTEDDSCETYSGCYRYQVSYEQVPETGNRFKVITEVSLGCTDTYIREFCDKTNTNRTGPCFFCYKNFCNLQRKIDDTRNERGDSESFDNEREDVPALIDPVELINRKPKSKQSSPANRCNLTLAPISFFLITSIFYY